MITKRLLLFLIGCIGSRTALTILAKNIDSNYLPYIGYVTMIMALSFFYIYIFGSERADRQLEWDNEKTVWWNDFRVVHGLLYLAFSVSAIQKYSNSWIFLLIDTTIGLIAWSIHHKFIRI